MSIKPPTARDVATELTPATPAGRSTTQLAQVAIERFDEYVIVAKIGQGGMAEVFLALAQGPGAFRKLLVVKRLHVHMGHDDAAVRMFMREATLAARLHHPNVVQTNKVGVHGAQPFLAMEYLEGQPLHRVVQRLRSDGRTLGAVLSARIAAEVLAGLSYAHELADYDGTPLGIVHRDVSPHNVFVTYDGQVKLLDFGIAKAALDESHTRTGLIKGKFSYIAPEQARGDAVDARADLWSVGVTLWECLCGERPFRGQNEVALLRAVLTDELPLLSDVARDVPESLARIVERALSRDPSLRFPSARAFRDELLAFLRDEETEDARIYVSEQMKALFGDKLEERRETVRRCVAQVARSESSIVPPPLPARTSLPPAPRAKKRLFAALLTVAVVALALIWSTPSAAPELLPLARDPGTARPAAASAPPAASPVVADAPAVAPRTESPRPQHAITAAHAPLKPRPSTAPRPHKVAHAQPAFPAPAVEPEREPPSLPAPGRLALDSTPYAIVTLDGVKLGITPLEVELPAATHTLVLRNPEQGIETTYRVTIPPGERVSRRVALE